MKTQLLKPMTGSYDQYLKDESQKTGSARYIAFPGNEAEVAEVVRACLEEGIPVTVQGGRTGIAGGCVPGGGAILNLSRMNRVLGCRQPENGGFAFAVEPGLVLSEFEKMVAGRKFSTGGWSSASIEAYGAFLSAGGYFLPVDPTERSASLGGMAACNASGARSYKYGPIRKHISCLRAVLADGRVIYLKRGLCMAEGYEMSLPVTGGGTIAVPVPTYRMPAAKNASGYFAAPGMDAVDLFIGSDGTLAVITQLEVTLSPLPGCIWGATAFFPGEEQAVRYVLEMKRPGGEGVAALEYFDADALNVLRRQKAENEAFAGLLYMPGSACAAVYTEFHCRDETEALSLLFRSGEAISASGGSEEDTFVARTGNDLLSQQFFRHAIPESVNMDIARLKRKDPAITKLATDMAVPDGRLADCIALYRNSLARTGLHSVIWGHIGDNHLHVNIIPQNADEYERGKELYKEWAKEITMMGGAVSAEHSVGKLKTDYLEIMYGQKHIEEMRALKAALDPGSLLGRGNMFKEERARL